MKARYEYNGRELFPTVEIYPDFFPAAAGLTMGEFYGKPEACVEAYRKGREYLKNEFGDMIPDQRPAQAPLSYGHLACIGSEIIRPADGEPNARPAADSVDSAIDIMRNAAGRDFGKAPIVAFYDRMTESLRKAFPEYDIPFGGLGVEGPVTTAVLLRGQDFFIDLYDEYEKCMELLRLITDSIISYHAFLNVKNGKEPFPNRNAWLCDDFAALVSPDMWDEVVIQWWEKWFSSTGKPGGRRKIHCEGMYEAQLPHMKPLGITAYQPSVSDRITLDVAVKYRGIAYADFDFLLYTYRVVNMTDAEIQSWVDDTVEAGVSIIRTQFGAYAYGAGKADRIHSFFKAFDKYRKE